MTFSDVMGLLGGLALFLYGMQMMSSGLENVAGNKMKQILEMLTDFERIGDHALNISDEMVKIAMAEGY